MKDQIKQTPKGTYIGIRITDELCTKIDNDAVKMAEPNRSYVIRQILNEFYSNKGKK